MHTIRPYLIIGAVVLCIPFAGVAAEGEGSGIAWSSAFKIAVVPLLVFAVVMLVFAVVFRSMKRNPITRRYEDHMDRVESLLARIADTLEKKSQDENKL